jgi:hypothetical protein
VWMHPGADDALRTLGLPATATLHEIEAARRALAKRAHPDMGGSLDEMQRINAAADAARIGARTSLRPPSRPAPRPMFVRHDNPSFTVEALPAAAFEALLIVAATLGEVIEDDPPYRLELALSRPMSGWCRLELMPEAGASSVALSVAGEPGQPPPDLDRVRDAFVTELNQLDWDQLQL